MNFHLTVEEAKQALKKGTNPYVLMIKDKAMSVEYFAPKATDTQTPHAQDELYIIVAGSSEVVREVEIVKCKTGDVLFVPAGMMHHFRNCSDDFATWVVFY